MKELEAATSQLIDAQEKYKQALDRKQVASRDECDAVNRLNEAQRTFDSVVSEIKKATPGGDWKSDRVPKYKES